MTHKPRHIAPFIQQALPAAEMDGINERIDQALGAAAAAVKHVLPLAVVVGQDFDAFQC
jgi:hypothetical protein